MNETTSSPPKNNLAGQAKDFAKEVRDKTAHLTGDVKRVAKDRASQLGNAAKDLATNASEKVQDKMQEAVSVQKSAGADYIEAIAQAAGRAAGEFDAALPPAARYIRDASGQIQNVADAVRHREVRELVGEVENFARQQPALFFGGAVVLGFAALRFLKSSPPAQYSSAGSDYSDYETFEQPQKG